MTTFEIFKRNNGKHYYRVISDTGHNIISSDSYVQMEECLSAIDQLKDCISDSNSITLRESTDRNWKFTVSGKDNSIIGYSMEFNSKSQCNKWIRLLQHDLPNATVVKKQN